MNYIAPNAYTSAVTEVKLILKFFGQPYCPITQLIAKGSLSERRFSEIFGDTFRNRKFFPQAPSESSNGLRITNNSSIHNW